MVLQVAIPTTSAPFHCPSSSSSELHILTDDSSNSTITMMYQPTNASSFQMHKALASTSSSSSGAITSPSLQRSTSMNTNNRPRARFPMKLRTVLKDAAMEGNDHIISWLPHGKAFKVHKPDLFASQIMKRYFRQSHFRSFTRQLYHYGFERCEEGAFSHPLFQRDDETLSWNMGRKLKTDEDTTTPTTTTQSASQVAVALLTKKKQMMSFHSTSSIKKQGIMMPQQSQHNMFNNMSSLNGGGLDDPLTLSFTSNPFMFDNDDTFTHSINSYNNKSNTQALVNTTQDAIDTASDLSSNLFLLEPRPIEQMCEHPINVEDSFGRFWPTEV